MIFYDLAARLSLSIHLRALEIDWAHGQFYGEWGAIPKKYLLFYRLFIRNETSSSLRCGILREEETPDVSPDHSVQENRAIQRATQPLSSPLRSAAPPGKRSCLRPIPALLSLGDLFGPARSHGL